jgi:UDP-N-acetylmuramate dehydrogenase
VADAGFAGLAVTLGGVFAELEVAVTAVRAGAAVSLPVLARRTAAAGLTGLEWAVGVPGSVGGAVRMNAGGHGSDVSRTLTRARIVDLATGDDSDVSRERLALGYRSSSVLPHQVVARADFELAPGDRVASEAEIADIVRWRRENQPGGSNAGSVFTNPPGDSAGRLIDAAGLKGQRVGSAHVSPKHANFFQADEGGSADDVLALIEEVQRLVEERTGIRLEPELRLIGFAGPEVRRG